MFRELETYRNAMWESGSDKFRELSEVLPSAEAMQHRRR